VSPGREGHADAVPPVLLPRRGTQPRRAGDPRVGAVLPILHLNGYKIANPALLARIPHDDLDALLRGYGYAPRHVVADDPERAHQDMAAALDDALDEIRAIQRRARSGERSQPRWPLKSRSAAPVGSRTSIGTAPAFTSTTTRHHGGRAFATSRARHRPSGLGEGFRGPPVVRFAGGRALDEGHDVDEAGKLVAGDQGGEVGFDVVAGRGGRPRRCRPR
jgi:XFP-like protein